MCFQNFALFGFAEVKHFGETWCDGMWLFSWIKWDRYYTIIYHGKLEIRSFPLSKNNIYIYRSTRSTYQVWIVTSWQAVTIIRGSQSCPILSVTTTTCQEEREEETGSPTPSPTTNNTPLFIFFDMEYEAIRLRNRKFVRCISWIDMVSAILLFLIYCQFPIFRNA